MACGSIIANAQPTNDLDAVVQSKLKVDIFQEIEFRECIITDVVDFLGKAGKMGDSFGEGDQAWRMPVLLVPKDKSEAIPLVTISGKNISRYDLLSKIAAQTGLEFVIKNGRPVLKFKQNGAQPFHAGDGRARARFGQRR